MPRQDIEFKTSDDVTLRGWLYTPEENLEAKLPCLVMSHGFSAIKEMVLDQFAEAFVSKLRIMCLVYDNRGFGSSDCAQGQPRQEIIPSVQISDIQDAITYVQTRDEIDASRTGVWGSSYSGGHCLQVAAIDRRVKACIAQAPFVNGWETARRVTRPDFMAALNPLFQSDRIARAAGQTPATVPVVGANPMARSVLPSADSYEFFSPWEAGGVWKNEVTARSVEAIMAYDPSHHITHISPTPLLMVVATNDCVTPTDIALRAYAQALEPKELVLLPGGHFDAYKEPAITDSIARQVKFLQENLCK